MFFREGRPHPKNSSTISPSFCIVIIVSFNFNGFKYVIRKRIATALCLDLEQKQIDAKSPQVPRLVSFGNMRLTSYPFNSVSIIRRICALSENESSGNLVAGSVFLHSNCSVETDVSSGCQQTRRRSLILWPVSPPLMDSMLKPPMATFISTVHDFALSIVDGCFRWRKLLRILFVTLKSDGVMVVWFDEIR